MTELGLNPLLQAVEPHVRELERQLAEPEVLDPLHPVLGRAPSRRERSLALFAELKAFLLSLRTDAGRRAAQLDLRQPLRQLSQEFAPEIERRGLTWVDRLDLDPLWARIPPAWIGQIGRTLLWNACRYNRPNGQIILEPAETDHETGFSLSDTGIGMTPDEHAGLFQPLYRCPRPETEPVPGLGMGLYLARHLARAGGGDLIAASQPQVGSCFTFRWPKNVSVE